MTSFNMLLCFLTGLVGLEKALAMTKKERLITSGDEDDYGYQGEANTTDEVMIMAASHFSWIMSSSSVPRVAH
jgi:hypothetical protein